MDIIKWNDELSVGVVEMDRQHKKLIGMINQLIQEQRVLSEPETIAGLLTDMTEYAREHFRAEEYLMSEYGYEFKDKQVAQHNAFIDKTMRFCAADMGVNILSRALLEYLSSWLVNHILKEDMQYKAYFIAKGIE